MSSFFDPLILVPVAGLSTMSLSILVSTTPRLFWYQAIFFLVGLVLYILFSAVDARIWARYVWILYALSVLALLTSYFGPSVRGASRWIEFGNIRIQPSELIKPFMTLVLAWVMTRKPYFTYGAFFLAAALFLPVAFLIFHQPDLGNVLVFVGVLIAMVLMGGMSWRVVASVACIAVVLMPVFWTVLRPYQRQRIMTFINPHVDPIGTGYNALQAMIALGSGQLYGQGLGRGTQSHLLFLPEYHTDFVFASLGEELGFIGSSLVLGFYMLLLGRILWIACDSQDAFIRLFTIGIFAQLFIQVFINIGMNIGVVPITGITLPLVSYGGSSILSIMIGLGLVVSLRHPRRSNPLVIR